MIILWRMSLSWSYLVTFNWDTRLITPPSKKLLKIPVTIVQFNMKPPCKKKQKQVTTNDWIPPQISDCFASQQNTKWVATLFPWCYKNIINFLFWVLSTRQATSIKNDIVNFIFFRMKIIANVTQSSHQDCDLCYLHLPIFSYIYTLLFCCKI